MMALEKKASNLTLSLSLSLLLVLWVIDGCRANRSNPLEGLNQKTIEKLGFERIPITLVLNKIDQPQFMKKNKAGLFEFNQGRVNDIVVSFMKSI